MRLDEPEQGDGSEAKGPGDNEEKQVVVVDGVGSRARK